MTKLLWMTIDRHPESLRELIRERLSETGWDILEVSYDSINAMESLPLEEIKAVLLAPARFFPPEYMDRLTQCRLMQIWSSGYDKFNIDDAHSRGIPVANNHGSNAVSVAEHTILMMLGVSRRAPEMHNRVITGNWAGNDHGMASYSLSGKTLGIVGLGNIGTLVAKRAEALGMRIIFSDPRVQKSPSSSWKKQTFDQLVEQSNYITFHLHLEPSTQGMVDSGSFANMGKRPFLINVSRAELIDKLALTSALARGAISGVAMDTHYKEPTSRGDPLLKFPNVIFSPHVAGSTRDSYEAMVSACVSNIDAAFSGGNLLGVLRSPPGQRSGK